MTWEETAKKIFARIFNLCAITACIVVILCPFLFSASMVSPPNDVNSFITVVNNGTEYHFTNTMKIDDANMRKALKFDESQSLYGNDIEKFFKDSRVLGTCWRQYRRITHASNWMLGITIAVMLIFLVRFVRALLAKCNGKNFGEEFLDYKNFGPLQRSHIQMVQGILILVAWVMMSVKMFIVLYWNEQNHCKIDGSLEIESGFASIVGWIGIAVPATMFTVIGIISSIPGGRALIPTDVDYMKILGEPFL